MDEIKRGFKFRNINSQNEYEILRTTRKSWILKRIDVYAGESGEIGMSHDALKKGIKHGFFEDLDKKYNRIKLKF